MTPRINAPGDPQTMTASTTTDQPLADRLVALATWADRVPHHARAQAAAGIDRLAVLLGRLVAEADDGSPQ